MLGGAMRQSGYLAAAGRYALAHHVDRLADDHRRARVLAERVADLPGVRAAPDEVETNIVVLGVDDAPVVQDRLAQEGVEVDALDARRLRVVTHLGVSDADVDHLVRALATATRPPARAGIRDGTALPAGAPRAGR
jgi:threonine aldolase